MRIFWAITPSVLLTVGCAALNELAWREKPLCPTEADCGVTLYRGGIANAVAVKTPEGTILFDTKLPGRFGAGKLRERVPNVNWVGITHPHCDHIGGLSHFADRRPVVWGAPSISGLFPRPGGTFRLATGPVNATAGGVTVVVMTFEHAHTGGDAVFWLPQKKLLIMGDLFQCGLFPHAERDDGGSYSGLVSALDRVEQLVPEPDRAATS